MSRETLLDDLIKSYKRTHQKSEEIFKEVSRFQIRGGSHNLRLFSPFPFYDIKCSGSKVIDVDGNVYVDFWQGHFANILGHNPRIVLNALADYFRKGQGLTTGFPGSYQRQLAELILDGIPAEKIRFSTSGTLGSMYAMMLAISYTKRDMVMKVGGGWHGAQPYALKGISEYEGGLNRLESAGLPANIDLNIILTKFNDVEDLEEKFRENGERIACLIIEPFIGAGGFIFGKKEYIQRTRELTQQYGSLLIFDEVVSGFRFHAGALQSLYGINPDLSIFGKAIGGGMPVSAVAGREDIMALCDAEARPGEKVKFEGGTFSAHPASMLAGVTFVKYLKEHENEIYPRIGQYAEKVRKEIEKIFARYEFNVKCTGADSSITRNSSLVGVQFLQDRVDHLASPEQVWNPAVCDLDLRDKLFRLSMLEEGFNIFHGFGSFSTAHSGEEIQSALDAVERIAKKWREYDLVSSKS